MTTYTRELNLAKDLARDAGRIMLRYFNSAAARPELKHDRTIVTQADTEINRHVLERLQAETPGYSIWGEEESAIIPDAPYTWVCDPVDGTQPFAKGIPISTFSLGLVDAHGHGVLGVVYDPFQDRLYEAVKDHGAKLNGASLQVSGQAEFDGAYLDSELWLNSEEEVHFDDPRDSLSKAGARVTTMCSAVIMGCLVAEGAYDAMLFGQGKPEDIAALSVIVTEAGGRVTDLFGHDQRYDTNIRGAIVSNGALHAELVQALQGIHYSSKYL